MISKIKHWFLLLLILLIISNSLASLNLEENSTQSNTFKRKFNINNEVCKNGDHCSSRKIIYLRSKTHIKVLKRIVCPCIGKFMYSCGNDYCTLNKTVCDRMYTNVQFIAIKKCGNDNTIVT